MQTLSLQTARGQARPGQAYSRFHSAPFVATLPAGLPVGCESRRPAGFLANKWGVAAERAKGPLQLSVADMQNKLPFTSHLHELNSELIHVSKHSYTNTQFPVTENKDTLDKNMWIHQKELLQASFTSSRFDAFYLLFLFTTLTFPLLFSRRSREGFTSLFFFFFFPPPLSWLCGGRWMWILCTASLQVTLQHPQIYRLCHNKDGLRRYSWCLLWGSISSIDRQQTLY